MQLFCHKEQSVGRSRSLTNPKGYHPYPTCKGRGERRGVYLVAICNTPRRHYNSHTLSVPLSLHPAKDAKKTCTAADAECTCLWHAVSYRPPPEFLSLPPCPSPRRPRDSVTYTHWKGHLWGGWRGACCPQLCDRPTAWLYALCNQRDYSGIRGSTPQRLSIVALHLRQSAHTAWSRSAVNTRKSMKWPTCQSTVLPMRKKPS